MTDTPPEIERMMRESAREMVKASLRPGLSQTEQRRELFKRLYGKEIDIG
jgi:hypothetical protein